MPKLTFGLLLSLLDLFLTSTEYFLGTFICIQDDSKCSSHVDWLHIVVVKEILSSQITFVTMYKLYLVRYIRPFWVFFEWATSWLLDSAKPRFTRHELIAFRSVRFCKWVITSKLDRIFLGFLTTCQAHLTFELSCFCFSSCCTFEGLSSRFLCPLIIGFCFLFPFLLNYFLFLLLWYGLCSFLLLGVL